jgi:hypothetical protein
LSVCQDQFNYSIDAGLHQNLITSYDYNTLTICIYSENMALLEQQVTYTINASLVMWSHYEHRNAFDSGLLSFITPCNDAVLTAQTVTDLYVVIGQLGTKIIPVVTVDPVPCTEHLRYECDYLNGGFGIDLCSFDLTNNGQVCEASFGYDNGQAIYKFECHDQTVIAPGQYVISIIGLVMNSPTVKMTFTLHVNEKCAATPQINFDPFSTGPYVYVLGDPQLVLPYNTASIGFGVNAGTCGEPTVEFDCGWGIGSGVISIDYTKEELKVGYTEDFWSAMDYFCTYKFYFEFDQQNFVTSEEFTISVLDPCGEANLTLTPPLVAPIVYTIGQDPVTVEIGEWTQSPAECGCWLWPDIIDDGGLGMAVNFDSVNIIISDSWNIDLAGEHIDGTEYKVLIGVECNGSLSDTEISVTIKNPCFDSAYINVVAPQLEDFHYILYMSQSNTWTHSAFTIDGDFSIAFMCGNLKCEMEAGPLTPAITYNEWIYNFLIYSEDMDLLEQQDVVEYNIKCYLRNYPECKDNIINCGSYATGMIHLHSPCISPTELT